MSTGERDVSSSVGLRLRQASAEEREALEDLQRRASLVREDYRADLLAHPEAIDLPAERMDHAIVAEDDGRLLGFSVTLPRADGDWELDGLFIEPDVWGRGIGAALVRRAVDDASDRGAGALWVISGASTEGFYTRSGFERIGSAETRFGPAISMRKQLSAR